MDLSTIPTGAAGIILFAGFWMGTKVCQIQLDQQIKDLAKAGKMKRINGGIFIQFLLLTILLTLPTGSFGQTATPTPTATPTITNTRTPFLKVGGIQSNNADGLVLLEDDGDPIAVFDQTSAIGDSPSPSYKFSVSSKPGDPQTSLYVINSNTSEAAQWGAKYYSRGLHGTSVNIGSECAASGSTVGNRGGDFASSGPNGTYNMALRAIEFSTSPNYKYGLNAEAQGANGTNYGVYCRSVNGDTNWDLFTWGIQSRINGLLQLTDSGQQITVNTSTDSFCFGNGTDASQVVIDTTYGDVLLKGKLNLGAGSALTISSNAVTVIRTRHSITASGASDTLNTINGYVDGDTLRICGTSGKTITVSDGGGNIQCGSNITLDGANDWVGLFYDGTNWQKQWASLDN